MAVTMLLAYAIGAVGSAASAQPAAAVTYVISVGTSDVENAGTDGGVEVRLNGSQGSSGFMVLDSSIDNFERSTTNRFDRTVAGVGTLRSVDVRFTNSGDHPDWHLGQITVSGGGSTGILPCHCWFRSSRTSNVPVAVGPTTYPINVVTSDVEDAGTDADVEVRLNGSLRSSGFMFLDSSIDNYERDTTDRFTRILSNLGTLRSVDVRFIAKGDDVGWHLAYISVPAAGATRIFPCHCWISTSTTRNLPVA